MARPILILACMFPPENIIGALRPARFARYLPRYGYAPVVITASPQPEPHQGVIEAPFRHGFLERILGRTLFPHDDRITWTSTAVSAARSLISESFRPILLSTSPPVSTHWAAYRLKQEFDLPWIADFRDPLVGNFVRVHPLPRRIDRFIERRIALTADRVLLNTPYSAAAFCLRYPDGGSKVDYLYNGFDPDDELAPRPIPVRDRKVWIHSGSIYRNRYPERLLAGLDRLVSGGKLEQAFCLRMIGSIEDKSLLRFPPFERLLARGLIDCYPDVVPREQALRELAEADGAVVFDHYHAGGPNLAIPAKTFEAVRVGRPVLVFTSRGAPLHSMMEACGVRNVCIFDDDPLERIDEKLLEFSELPQDPLPPSETFQRQFSGIEQTRQLAAWLDEL
jgi:glycosyltransferase involved in cell wall biosynthesis